MKCENCGEEHVGKYASGRFCSEKCSRGFSTKSRRNEINIKVSDKLSKPHKINICAYCGRHFPVSHSKKFQRYCSHTCGSLGSNNRPEVKAKHSLSRIQKIKEGIVNNAKVSFFPFNNNEIRCDSKLEYTCLYYFTQHFSCKEIKRNGYIIPYMFEGEERLFLPDFIIITDIEKFLIEVKTIVPQKELRRKWQKYRGTAEEKQKVLVNFAKSVGLAPFWYTDKTDNKLYKEILKNWHKILNS